MAGNKSFHRASKVKEDEFYTKLTDIEKEMKHYKEHFLNKIIFCNCDDPEYSNYWKYFELNFNHLGLKKLIATHYEYEKPSYKLELMVDENNDGHVNSKDIIKTPLMQSGDFRSPECIKILKEADIIITNPPFSLFREYVSQLIEYNKKFIIIGNQNAYTYQEIFPLLQADKVWPGYKSGSMEFIIPDHYETRPSTDRIDSDGIKYRKLGNICWFTNFEIDKRNEKLILYKKYTPEEYPQYDNYNAINVNKVTEIPADYDGVMGVPITFLDKYNPEQFEILGITDRQNTSGLRTKTYIVDDSSKFSDLNRRSVLKIDGKYKLLYARILIKRRG